MPRPFSNAYSWVAIMAAGHAFVGLMCICLLLMFKLHPTISQILSKIDMDVYHRHCDLTTSDTSYETGFPSYYQPDPNYRHICFTVEVLYRCKIVFRITWRKRYLRRNIPYYSNSVAVHSILLLAEDVAINPGDKPKCSDCQRTYSCKSPSNLMWFLQQQIPYQMRESYR